MMDGILRRRMGTANPVPPWAPGCSANHVIRWNAPGRKRILRRAVRYRQATMIRSTVETLMPRDCRLIPLIDSFGRQGTANVSTGPTDATGDPVPVIILRHGRAIGFRHDVATGSGNYRLAISGHCGLPRQQYRPPHGNITNHTLANNMRISTAHNATNEPSGGRAEGRAVRPTATAAHVALVEASILPLPAGYAGNRRGKMPRLHSADRWKPAGAFTPLPAPGGTRPGVDAGLAGGRASFPHRRCPVRPVQGPPASCPQSRA